jgi:hypothetical protein
MTLSQFAELISKFGPVVDRWPPALIEPALDLMHGSLAAQDLFAKASAKDMDDIRDDAPAARPRSPGAAVPKTWM